MEPERARQADPDAEDIVREVLEDNADAVREYRDDVGGALNYLMGQVMAEAGGTLDPGKARTLIDDVIEQDTPDWPVTFTVYRRPADRHTVGERLANELPSWADRPEEFDDPTAYEFGFEVTVGKDGSVVIEVDT